MKPPFFDERRLSDPQGVIDDLLKQQTQQAVTINGLLKDKDELLAEVRKLNSMLAKQG